MTRYIAYSKDRPVPFSPVSHRYRDCCRLKDAKAVMEWSDADDSARRAPRKHCKICENKLKMGVPVPSVKNRVHKETQLVKGILSLPVDNSATIAKICGCSRSYANKVKAFHSSRAHVFLPPETLAVLNENNHK